MLVARRNHHADFLDARLDHSIHHETEHAALDSVPVDQALERQPALARCRGSNDGFSDSHDSTSAKTPRTGIEELLIGCKRTPTSASSDTSVGYGPAQVGLQTEVCPTTPVAQLRLLGSFRVRSIADY